MHENLWSTFCLYQINPVLLEKKVWRIIFWSFHFGLTHSFRNCICPQQAVLCITLEFLAKISFTPLSYYPGGCLGCPEGDPSREVDKLKNPSIYNIICWVAWRMGQTNRRPGVWCSKYYLCFMISCKILCKNPFNLFPYFFL